MRVKSGIHSASSHVKLSLSPDLVTTQAQPLQVNSIESPFTVYVIALPANVPEPLPSRTISTALANGLPDHVPANASRVYAASLVKVFEKGASPSSYDTVMVLPLIEHSISSALFTNFALPLEMV